MIRRNDSRNATARVLFVVAGLAIVWGSANASLLRAQESPVAVDAADIQAVLDDQPEAEAPPASSPSGIDLLSLMMRGGGFMIPIGIMSLMVVALAVERMLSLRVRKVIPPGLAEDLEDLVDPIDRFDPTVAYQSCLAYPSATARVVTAMLMRTGQPLSDVERAASEAMERETEQCVGPIRWLTLAAAATPLMGLLGTVWGMIVAFHESTSLTPDRSRSEQLSEGIYTALVTTLAGLIVAIPAAILALYLENRLAKLFHRVEQIAFDVAPGLRRFTGRQRMDLDGALRPIDAPPPVADVPQPPPPPRPSKARDNRGGAKAG